jgi:acyl-CoA reductase-like NAD-dependent aldehyde dehydrogenase
MPPPTPTARRRKEDSMNAPIRVVSPSTASSSAGARRREPKASTRPWRGRGPLAAWAGLPYRERVLAINRFRAIVRGREIAETLVSESGKPYWEALGAEVTYICEVIRFSIGAARRVQREETRNPFLLMVKKTRLVRKPLGVVGVIGPWNFPILNNAADCVGPLLGNTVVLKPPRSRPSRRCSFASCGLRPGTRPTSSRS